MTAERARVFAIAAHEAAGQRRKYTGRPYWEHPARVAALVAEVLPGDEEAEAAAWLHDVVEDTAVGLDTIHGLFGSRVARLVGEVTDVSRPEDGNRAARKAIDREHLAGASPAGQTIKLADMIDNLRSIATHDPAFAKVYLAEKERLVERLGLGSPALRGRLDAMCAAVREEVDRAEVQEALRP